jgi:hypothetical protein
MQILKELYCKTCFRAGHSNWHSGPPAEKKGFVERLFWKLADRGNENFPEE